MAKDTPNHVSLGKHQCPVCDKIHDHNAVVCVAKDMRKDLPRDITVGFGLCEEHDKPGFVALIVATDITKTQFTRTGEVAHCKTDAFKNLFEQDPPKDRWILIDPKVFTWLQKLATEAEETKGTEDAK